MIDVLIGHRIHFLKQSDSTHLCRMMKAPPISQPPIRLVFATSLAIFLIALVFPACTKSPSTGSTGKKNAESNFTEEQIETELKSHFDSVFADLKIENQAAFEMDQQRVRDVHQIARLAAAYHEKAGHYPLVTPEGSMKNAIMAPGQKARQKTDVTYEDFVSELKKILGKDITVPTDPSPGEGGSFSYSYSAYGQGYTTAAILYHHAPFSEKMGEHYCQYRVGSMENKDLPILQFSKIVDGTSTVESRQYQRGR